MKLIKNRPFKATVTVNCPGDEQPDDNSFTGHFVTLSLEEIKALPLGTTDREDAYLNRVFTGWEGLIDSNDAPFEVTPENRTALLNEVAVRHAIIQAYAEELMGLRRGN